MTSAFSWQNSISLCPASFDIPRPNLPVTPGVFWLPTFAFQSSIMKRTSFLCVLVLQCLVGLHRTVEFQLLQRYWLGHRLGLPWYWMVCLGNEQRSFCRFWDCIQVTYNKLHNCTIWYCCFVYQSQMSFFHSKNIIHYFFCLTTVQKSQRMGSSFLKNSQTCKEIRKSYP